MQISMDAEASSTTRMVIFAGIAAGVVSTVVQVMLWWISDVTLPETFYRDTRLAAAILMPREIIAPEVLMTQPSIAMLAVASFIHFGLSLVYAAVFQWFYDACLADKSPGLVVLAGAVFGLFIYANNMYGFTFLFPWFAMVRDVITIAAHAVFGVTLAMVLDRAVERAMDRFSEMRG